MTERTLGSIIVGGIAAIGLVWSLLEGTIATTKAKNIEKHFEKDFVNPVQQTIQKENLEYELDNVDLKTCVLKTSYEKVKVWISETRYQWKNVYINYLVFEGYTKKSDTKDKVLVGLKLDEVMLADDQQKLTLKESSASMNKDLYKNYSYSVTSLLDDIVVEGKFQVYNIAINDQYIYGSEIVIVEGNNGDSTSSSNSTTNEKSEE